MNWYFSMASHVAPKDLNYIIRLAALVDMGASQKPWALRA